MGKLSDAEKLMELRKTQYRRYLERSLIHLSFKTYLEMRLMTCPTCGGPLKDPKIYFGDKVCGECKHNLDPMGIYDKHLKGKVGFKSGRTR